MTVAFTNGFLSNVSIKLELGEEKLKLIVLLSTAQDAAIHVYTVPMVAPCSSHCNKLNL
jgi:hypothetical protein